jgi:hypothetical protein
MESFLKLGALPPNPRDLSLFSRQNGRLFSWQFEGDIGCRPLPFRPLNRSLGSHPCVALSRPGQVASVCIKAERRSTPKRQIVTTNLGNSSFDW